MEMNAKAEQSFDMKQSIMEGWIQSFTGRRVYPLALTPDQISLEDIAHALALKCRFTGHCTNFYSIAQHSVLASRYVDENFREALMHDAAEYILPDVATPIKHLIPGFKELEHQVEKVIAERFDLKFPWPANIKEIDNRLVVTERRDFMLIVPELKWDIPAEPLTGRLHSWGWRDAAREFLKTARTLGVE
jgi:hypothetical protein